MEPALPVVVEEIRPSAIYRGRVYTQDLEISIDGLTFSVYDPSRIVTPEVVGDQRHAHLHVFCAVVEAIDTGRSVTEDAEGRPAFQGEIVDAGGEGKTGVLDVGGGTVGFAPSEANQPLSGGDFVSISRAAIHLQGIEGEREWEENVKFFLKRLGADDPAMRAEAAEWMGTTPSDRFLDSLRERLEDDPDPSVRKAAAEALGRIGRDSNVDRDRVYTGAKQALSEATKDSDESVREAAQYGLDHLDDRY